MPLLWRAARRSLQAIAARKSRRAVRASPHHRPMTEVTSTVARQAHRVVVDTHRRSIGPTTVPGLVTFVTYQDAHRCLQSVQRF